MSEAFDPYHKWLGIAPKDQPPNHYRLLGIDPFESDPDVIAHAADQRMIFIRALQTTEHADLPQEILNQICAARVCLLDPERKLQYNQQLREALQLKPKAPRSILPEQVREEAKRARKSASQKANTRLSECGHCGGTVSKRAELCPHCGAKNPPSVLCPDCDATISQDVETCPNCGAANPLAYLVPTFVVPEPEIIVAETVEEETPGGTIPSGRESAAWVELMRTIDTQKAEPSKPPGEPGPTEMDKGASGAKSVHATIEAFVDWVRAVDNILHRMAGDGNTILHNFLRCMAAFVPIAIVMALIWMTLL